MLRRTASALSAILALSLLSTSASAEYCNMLGCGVGYIFLPVDRGNGQGEMGEHHCTPAPDVITFKETDLPRVNQIVTLKAGQRRLFSEDEIAAQIDGFKTPYFERVNSAQFCAMKWKEPDNDLSNMGTLLAGDKFRILGYRTFVAHQTGNFPPGSPRYQTQPEQLLFVLVDPL